MDDLVKLDKSPMNAAERDDMRSILILLVGIATGALVTLTLPLPWTKAIDPNVAAVISALASTTLTVVGAYWLWSRQVRSKRHDLQRLIVPIFDPLYSALCQVRDLSERDRALDLLQIMAKAMDSVRPIDSEQAISFQEEAFPGAVEAAVEEARTATVHWQSIQDVLIYLPAGAVPDLLESHRIAVAATTRLPKLYQESLPQYLEQRGPQVSPKNAALLAWAIGRLARTLNNIDGGRRDDSGLDAMDKGRAAAIRSWGSTYGHW